MSMFLFSILHFLCGIAHSHVQTWELKKTYSTYMVKSRNNNPLPIKQPTFNPLTHSLSASLCLSVHLNPSCSLCIAMHPQHLQQTARATVQVTPHQGAPSLG